MFEYLKAALPDRPVPMRVWRGPFRGARVVMNPRTSLRKVLGLYEHELNGWLESVLDRVTRVVDVGANDGYFTFGCAAALGRRGVAGAITAIEAQARHVEELKQGVASQPSQRISIDVVHRLAGRETRGDFITLDDLPGGDRTQTLIKIDVEGAEVDVIAGAASWLQPSNYFVIEVHREEYIDQLRSAFAGRGLGVTLVRQRPLPIIGGEERDPNNWWLVSDLPRVS